ncbi:MAG: LLM class flavin-dependent oxidoreductase [Proteobacteria bacterium]|nr:LLM class flavin-dependent oxidoreductase [Pseudomonadota bacterium]MDA1325044.1 LLM class flavin-dependent oxidoreductase [Pseudomonadota bacterium]
MTEKKMQFGLAIRGQYAQDQDIRVCFEELIEECVQAEALGFDSITKTSHYSTAPFQAFQQFPLLARLSAETKRVRLNAGIILLSLHKPLDIAEQLATIDIMSNGRVICGVALGYREVEFAAFGAEVKQRGKRLEENLIALKRLWTEETVSMKGSHFELIEASCCPKPLQKPHPPIWIGANANVAIKRAARLGDCWYINPHNKISTIKEQMEIYKRALDEAGKPFPDELPMRREVFVAKTREEALRIAGPYIKKKYDAYDKWGQGDQMPEGDGNLAAAFDELAGDRFIIGSPDDVTEQIVNLHREIGMNHLIMSIQWADMPHSLTLDTMALLSEKVFPQVRQAIG